MHSYITVLVSMSCAGLSGAMAFLGLEYMNEGIGLTPVIAFPMATALLYIPFWFVTSTTERSGRRLEDNLYDVSILL